MSSLAIEISGLSHWYGSRQALCDLTLTIERGEVFAFLGPNGGGKTTLFRILSTLIPPRHGTVCVLGCDVARRPDAVRRLLGVVFQAPSLDKKLTVAENVRCQAALYGLSGATSRRRTAEVLDQLGLSDRSRDRTEELSGGLRRRVELAKGLVHRPRLLLMDEPSTGLDPGARSELWRSLNALRAETGVTIVMTTHLLEEADRVDRLAILDEGRLVALDSPDALRATIGGDSIFIASGDAVALCGEVRERFQVDAQVIDGRVHLELEDGPRWTVKLMDAFPGRIDSITVGKPTLEDVFMARAGHRFWRGAETGEERGR